MDETGIGHHSYVVERLAVVTAFQGKNAVMAGVLWTEQFSCE
jgi:hypothetical protein